MARYDPVVTGPRSSLLPRHVTRHIQHNWMRVEEVGLIMGAVLLCRKIKETATDDQLKQLETYFPVPSYPDVYELPKDPLRDHCDVIIQELGELIGMIRCAKCITHRINELNKAHAKMGISEECIQLIINSMILAIKTILGNSYSQDIRLAWKTFLEYVFQPQAHKNSDG